MVNVGWSQTNLDDALFGGNQESSQEESSQEDTDTAAGDDDLFQGGGSFISDVEEDPDANPADDLLTSETVTIGGSIDMSAEFQVLLNPDDDQDTVDSGLVDLNARFFLDARPDSDFRALVKGDIIYSTEDDLEFDLREAFADVDIDNIVFIRAGKQTINWGVGVFFSPANLINIERIDPEDTSAELAGPVAIKAQLPLGVNNLTGYLLTDDFESDDNIGIAGLYEFLFEGYEITVGSVYRYDAPWAVMATATGELADVTVYGEAVLEGNSDKVFLTEDATGLDASTSDDVFFSGTLGARFTTSTEDDRYTLSAGAQYFFNGQGYGDTSIFTDNPAAVSGLVADGTLSISDLTERGKHYAALSLSSPDVNFSDITPSVFWLGNLSDGSGFATATARYEITDDLSTSLQYRFNYGAEGAEYSPRGDSHSITLSLDFFGSF
ncbi:MAG: hypothetical protein AAF267_02985 [Deinococcota bacterium]